MKSDGFAPSQSQNLATTIGQHPSEANLLKLVALSSTNVEKPCSLKWPISGQEGARLVLSVTSLGLNERKGWGEQRTQLTGEPEWLLVLETDASSKELWKMRSGDINLLLSLTAFDSIEQISASTNQTAATEETKSQLTAPPLQTVIGAPTSQSLQSAVLRRMGLNETQGNLTSPLNLPQELL